MAPPASESSASELGPEQEARLKKRLTRTGSSFDMLALLRALRVLRYEPDEIFFENNMEESPTRSLVRTVRFLDEPVRRALVSVNMGLMGPNGPLPSYFHRFAEELGDREAFDLFLGFFDHLSLKNLFASLYPDYYSRYYDSWEGVRRSYLGICGLASLDRVHWLFSQCVPELSVRVTRSRFHRTSNHHMARTGVTRLDGTGIVGRGYQAEAHGFQVRFHAEYERNSRGRSWAQILTKRFEEQIAPILRLYHVEVSLSLWIENHESWAGLNNQGLLGYERLKENTPAGHEMVLYDGREGSVSF